MSKAANSDGPTAEKQTPPPRIPRLLLSHILHGEQLQEVLGDLEEHYRRWIDRRGRGRAHIWYWKQACAFTFALPRERLRGALNRLQHRTTPRNAALRGSPSSGFQMTNLLDELRQTIRKLARSPSFALVSVFTLAVGIAANTAIFSLVYGVVLRPLPFPEPERLVMVGHSAPGLDLPEIKQAFGIHTIYRQNNEVFDDLAVAQQGTQTLTGQGAPERLHSARVSHSFYNVMRVTPSLGRPTTEEDDVPGAPPVVLLSHGLWGRRYGANPDVIGQNIDIGSVSHEVIGVMPAGFSFPGDETDIWLPTSFDPHECGGFYLLGLGRLNPDVTVNQANSDLQRLLLTLPDYFTEFNAGIIENAQLRAVVTPLRESLVGNIQQTLWILLGAVGIVLVVACANVANLFLVRADARQREVAVRSALGASKSALVRFFLTESATLAGLGGLLGLLLAWVGIRTLTGMAPAGIPRLDGVGINAPVLAFTAAISVLSGLFFGSFPIARHAAPDIAAILKEGGRSTSSGRARHRIRHLLVVAQIALAVVLLVGSGLMVRSFQRLRAVDPGFDPSSVLTFRVSLPNAEYSDALSAVQFHQEITERIERLPGVLAVGSANGLPLTGVGDAKDPLLSEDHPVSPNELPPIVYVSAMSPGYFQAMRVPLLAGRTMEPSDARNRTGAVLVSAALAHHFWPNENALGKRVYPGLIDDPAWYTVVGIVGDVRANSLRGESPQVIYVPTIGTNDAASWSPYSMAYAVRTSVPPLSLAPAVRAAIWEVNPNLPIAQTNTMEQIVADSFAQTGFAMLLIATAAAVALLLGTVGIYAVIAYVVGQRTGEIGIRIALGAQSFEVSRMVLIQGGVVALMGVAIGIVGAFGLTRLLGALLFDVSATDPTTYVTVALLLLAVALLASYLPARRAASVDPVEALRAE